MLSIVTPVLNGSQFIQKNIDSISKLKVPHEHIVVDGGSTDGTIDIILKNSSIKLVLQSEKNGMYGAIDSGFRLAKGEYLSWINCDDFIYPEKYNEFYLLSKSRNLDFASSNGFFNYSNEKRKVKVRSTIFFKFFLKNGLFPFSQPSVLYKKQLYLEAGGLNYNHFKIAGDIDLFFRMALVNKAKFGFINLFTTEFLKHGNSLGDNNTALAKGEIDSLNLIPKVSLFNSALLKLFRIFHI